MNLLGINSYNYKKEMEYHVSRYNAFKRNFQGSIHFFHCLINSVYEEIVRYEILIKQNYNRAVKIDKEVRKFMKYCLKELVKEMYTPTFNLQFPQFAKSVHRRIIISRWRKNHLNKRFRLQSGRFSRAH